MIFKYQKIAKELTYYYYYLTYGKGFKNGVAYLHCFLLCCHDYVAVK